MRETVESGEYAPTSEVVREALRGWSERQATIGRSRDLIAEAEKEEPLDGPAVLAEFRVNYRLPRN